MFLFFLLIFSLFSASQSAETNFTILCLNEGQKYAHNSERVTCDRDGFKKVGGILEQDVSIQQNCAEIFMFSCNRFLDFRLCLIGVQKAQLNHDCSKEYDFDRRKVVSKCCNACKLGSQMALAEKSCSTPNNTDPSVGAALHVCCKNSLNPKSYGNSVPALTMTPPILNPISTPPPSTTLSASTIGVTSTEKPETSSVETSSRPSATSTTLKPLTSTQPPQTTSTSTTTTTTSTVEPHMEVSRDQSVPVSLVNVTHPKDEIPKSIAIAPEILTNSSSIEGYEEEPRNLLPEERECLKSDNYYERSEAECECPEGFKVNDSKEGVCVDIDECSETIHNCENVTSCSNTIGSFTCSECSKGLALHNGSCISEVPKSLDNPMEIVIETSTFLPRECSPGLQYNVSHDTCYDIDECNENIHSCSSLNDCINTEGSYVCRSSTCESRYAFDNGSCADLECMAGFNFDQIRRICVETNECMNNSNICGPNMWCHNIRGNFECKCPAGLQKSSQQNSTSCEDVDECARGLHNCWGVQKCFNFNGGFECALNGENFSDFIENVEPNMVFPLEDLNAANIPSTEYTGNLSCLGAECWKFKEISLAYYCVSLSSSRDKPVYRCDLKSCPELHSLEREWECVPISMNFPHNTTTTTAVTESSSSSTQVTRSEPFTEGNSTSVSTLIPMCPEGYALLDGLCVDIDECAPRNKYCPDGSFCINTEGSHLCKECPLGERVEPGKEECTCNHEECSKFQGRSCQSMGAGTEKCLCHPEYFEDSRKENCYPRCPFGSSLNFTGIPKGDCACPKSHKKHDNFCLKLCHDSDDCEGGPCITHEYEGLCVCPKGFILDHAKEQCTDIDECKSKQPVCHRDDVCANSPGGYRCLNFECDEGFTPQKGLGRCLKEGNGRTHFIRKAAIGRIMRNIRENQILLSAKLPRAYILEQRELKINPIEYAKYIQVSIQTKGDGSQELIMKTNKPFQREGNVTIEVIADASENVFTYELRTNLYISRLPFTLDMIGHD